MATRAKSGGGTRSAVAAQREVQRKVDRKDATKAAKPKAPAKKAVQAGARKQPVKLPKQHLAKPGLEKDLNLQPRFLAPGYEGSNKLKGMAAIITGGDSGIGRAVAVLYAREGADVAIVYLSEDADAEETRKHVEAEGQRCVLLRGDVRNETFCRNAVARAVKAFGRLDILVNNAGFQEHTERLEDLTEQHLDLTVRTNVYGYFHMAKAVLPHLHEGSSIINTGSETGLFGSPGLLDYSATKGAIHAFTKALASNLVSRGIRVNAVAPGPVWTPFNPADKPAAEVAKFGTDNPMGRAAQPEEVAPAYVFLAAPSCASYISGAILPVMGGPKG
jgi:NAD(P)-dependent dehydrogenase (short-subunit alcohol dehydrogenase family)